MGLALAKPRCFITCSFGTLITLASASLFGWSWWKTVYGARNTVKVIPLAMAIAIITLSACGERDQIGTFGHHCWGPLDYSPTCMSSPISGYPPNSKNFSLGSARKSPPNTSLNRITSSIFLGLADSIDIGLTLGLQLVRWCSKS